MKERGKGGRVGEQGQGESRKKHVFTKCWIDALILGNWGVKGRRRGENWKTPAVLLISPSLSPSFTPSFPLRPSTG